MRKTLLKKVFVWILAFSVLMLAGCQKNESDKIYEPQENYGSSSEKVNVVHPLFACHAYEKVERVDNINGWKQTLKECGIEAVEEIYQTEDGSFRIITANPNEHFKEKVDTYAVYETSGSIEFALVCEQAILEKYEVCEINGEPTQEEVVLCFDFMGNGGAGAHTTEVWTVEYGSLTHLFSSQCDLGFASILGDNYKIIIDNMYTGYQVKIDFYKEDDRVKYYFDENGKPLELAGANFEGAYETLIQDIDGDGDYELICKEYAYFPSRSDYIGSAITTIDYNKELYDFVVVDAKFVEPENDCLV